MFPVLPLACALPPRRMLISKSFQLKLLKMDLQQFNGLQATLRLCSAAGAGRQNYFHLHLHPQRREAHGSDFTQAHRKLVPGADH